MGGEVRVKKSLFFTTLLIAILIAAIEQWPKVATQEEEDCECLPFYQCNNEYGVEVITFKLREGTCKKDEICCPIPSKPTPETPTPLSSPILNEVCGIRNEDGLYYKISAGGDTFFGEFPWMVGLLFEKDGVEHFECGGSLIHYQVVLTAAHCVEKYMEGSENKNLVVRAGAWDINSTLEMLPHQNRRAPRIIIHKDFDSDTGFYDIALLILDKPFEEAKNLGIVCLPNHEILLDDKCIVTGWGKETIDGAFQSNLKSVEVPIVPRAECQALLRKTRLGKRFLLHESFICAGGSGGDSCEGDGGGPLICPVKDKVNVYQQVGIVSWGIDCNIAPGVYAEVAPLVKWIDEKLNTIGLKTNYK